MGSTHIEYALFNKPINPEANIPREDAWLFQEAFHTFPLGTTLNQVKLLFDAYVSSAKKRPRLVGTAQTPATVKLRVRRVSYSDYQDYTEPNNDTVTIPGKYGIKLRKGLIGA